MVHIYIVPEFSSKVSMHLGDPTITLLSTTSEKTYIYLKIHNNVSYRNKIVEKSSNVLWWVKNWNILVHTNTIRHIAIQRNEPIVYASQLDCMNIILIEERLKGYIFTTPLVWLPWNNTTTVTKGPWIQSQSDSMKNTWCDIAISLYFD